MSRDLIFPFSFISLIIELRPQDLRNIISQSGQNRCSRYEGKKNPKINLISEVAPPPGDPPSWDCFRRPPKIRFDMMRRKMFLNPLCLS